MRGGLPDRETRGRASGGRHTPPAGEAERDSHGRAYDLLSVQPGGQSHQYSERGRDHERASRSPGGSITNNPDFGLTQHSHGRRSRRQDSRERHSHRHGSPGRDARSYPSPRPRGTPDQRSARRDEHSRDDYEHWPREHQGPAGRRTSEARLEPRLSTPHQQSHRTERHHLLNEQHHHQNAVFPRHDQTAGHQPPERQPQQTLRTSQPSDHTPRPSGMHDRHSGREHRRTDSHRPGTHRSDAPSPSHRRHAAPLESLQGQHADGLAADYYNSFHARNAGGLISPRSSRDSQSTLRPEDSPSARALRSQAQEQSEAARGYPHPTVETISDTRSPGGAYVRHSQQRSARRGFRGRGEGGAIPPPPIGSGRVVSGRGFH